MDYAKHAVSSRRTPQSQPIPGREADQVENSAGGYAFGVDKWAQLERFLILGTESGTYYSTEHDLTKEAIAVLRSCIAENAMKVVVMIVSMRRHNRAPKMSPLLFSLAQVCKEAELQENRAYAYSVVNDLCWTATQLFEWVKYIRFFGGFGRGFRRAVSAWYHQPIEKISLQVAKYRSRHGWTHRDLLRVSHVKPNNGHLQSLLEKVVYPERLRADSWRAAEQKWLYWLKRLAETLDEDTTARMVSEHGIPWELLPSGMMKSKAVNDALLPSMGYTALLRQLGRLQSVGSLVPLQAATLRVAGRIADPVAVKASKIHPLNVLAAIGTYGQGHGARGNLEWGQPISSIMQALDDAFRLSFGNVKPTGKRLLIGLDVSGSMYHGKIGGIPGISPLKAEAAMSMIHAREPLVQFFGFSTGFVPLSITPRDTIHSAMKEMGGLPFGGTDCALPMVYALQSKIPVDCFIVYTDNETWSGGLHPCQALQDYRRKMNIPAKLIVVGMTSTGFSIADPADPLTMDVVGFDTAAPAAMAEFIGSQA